MEIENQILINKYGQYIIDEEEMMSVFNAFNFSNKIEYMNSMLFLISQSKPINEDIEPAITQSKLRRTFTPCVLIQKGVETYQLRKLLKLPENETNKTFILLLSLFRIAYQRRFQIEKIYDGKWWYSDLSDEKNVETILNTYK